MNETISKMKESLIESEWRNTSSKNFKINNENPNDQGATFLNNERRILHESINWKERSLVRPTTNKEYRRCVDTINEIKGMFADFKLKTAVEEFEKEFK